MNKIRSPPFLMLKNSSVKEGGKLMDREFKEYYIYVQNEKVVVEKEVYLEYHREFNKEKYEIRRQAKNKCLPFSSYDKDGNFISNIKDKEYDLEKIVHTKILIEKLKDALLDLSEDERELIKSIYFEEKSLRNLSKDYGISHPALIKRRDKILKKLRVMLE